MEREDIERLENSIIDFKCPNSNCCEYGDYAQCYNHSHSICNIFEAWYQSIADNKFRRIYNTE